MRWRSSARLRLKGGHGSLCPPQSQTGRSQVDREQKLGGKQTHNRTPHRREDDEEREQSAPPQKKRQETGERQQRMIPPPPPTAVENGFFQLLDSWRAEKLVWIQVGLGFLHRSALWNGPGDWLENVLSLVLLTSLIQNLLDLYSEPPGAQFSALLLSF